MTRHRYSDFVKHVQVQKQIIFQNPIVLASPKRHGKHNLYSISKVINKTLTANFNECGRCVMQNAAVTTILLICAACLSLYTDACVFTVLDNVFDCLSRSIGICNFLTESSPQLWHFLTTFKLLLSLNIQTPFPHILDTILIYYERKHYPRLSNSIKEQL